MRGNKNLETLIKLVIVIALALFLAYELLSGRIYYYVHPRYLYGIWFAVIALLVFAFSLMKEIKKGKHNSNVKQYLLYLLPLVLAVLFPAVEGGNGNIAIAQSSKGAETSYDTPVQDDSAGESLEETPDYEDADSSTDDLEQSWTEAAPVETDRSLKYKNKTEDGTILISDDEFSCWYFELFDYLKDFKGKRYQFTAQVFSMEDLKENQFLAGRYIMTCCAVDLTGYGIITESDKTPDLEKDQWITVTGTVEEYNYKGSKVPMLTDVVISKTEPPKEEYVYYYYY